MAVKGDTSVSKVLRFVIILQIVIGIVNTATLTEMEALHTSLFTGYNKNVRPISDQNSAINVVIYMYIKSIREFDEVDEKFSYVAALQVHWNDVKLQWDKSTNGGIEQITVSYDDVWVPEMTLSSPSSKGSTIGKSSDRIRIDEWGNMIWMPASLIESTCSVNAKKFPFDTQRCDTSFTSLGYKSNEVNLVAGLSIVSLEVYIPHALWDFTGSEVKTKLLGTGNESEITFTMNLKRHPTFAVINIIMPTLILSLLNVLVFILVPESGERIGYCITTLLAIAVYMTIVNDLLPQTAQPVPLISFKLLFDLLLSALIVFITIVNMRLYNRDDDDIVPSWIKSVYRFLTCTRRKIHPVETGKDEKVANNLKTTAMRNNTSKYKKTGSSDELGKSEEEDVLPVTWKKVSYMADWIAIFTFTFLSIMNTIIFVGMASS